MNSISFLQSQRPSVDINPSIIQKSTLLEMNMQKISSYLQTVQLENPVMELIYPEDYISLDNYTPSYNIKSGCYEEDSSPENYITSEHFLTDKCSLLEYFELQTKKENQSSVEYQIIHMLLNLLDGQGYLRESDEELMDFCKCSYSTLTHCINYIQSLSPAGVGARNLSNCFELQLKRKNLWNEELELLIPNHLENLANYKFRQIHLHTGIPTAHLTHYRELLGALDPHPGSELFPHEQIPYLIPDIIVTKHQNQFEVTLNNTFLPDIHISKEYADLYHSTESLEVKKYLKSNLQQACLIKENIEHRSDTLLRITNELVSYHLPFFEAKTSRLAPLSMSSLAKKIEIDTSTVSRAVNDKYLQCCQGTFPLKHFVMRALDIPSKKLSDNSCDSVSSKDVKEQLKEFLNSENHAEPYSDLQLTELLCANGFPISRRTVAKYRSELGYPNASGRKYMK